MESPLIFPYGKVSATVSAVGNGLASQEPDDETCLQEAIYNQSK